MSKPYQMRTRELLIGERRTIDDAWNRYLDDRNHETIIQAWDRYQATLRRLDAVATLYGYRILMRPKMENKL